MAKYVWRFWLCLFVATVVGSNASAHTVPATADKIGLFNDPTAAAFAKQLHKMIDKVSPACVLLTTYDLLASGNGAMASGVCVSEDGTIITAGHVTVPNGHYTVTFPDGKSVSAVGLGKIGSLDLGLLKITTAGIYPFVKMGWSAALKKGEPCFSVSYPGSFLTKRVVKLGHVEEINLKGNGNIKERYLKTACLMEPGDSGGPVFNMSGEVIGIRSYIGQALTENYDVPIDFYKMYWEALHKPVNYLVYPEKNILPAASLSVQNKVFDWAKIDEKLQAFAQKKELTHYCAIVSSASKEAESRIMGVVVNLEALASGKEYQRHSYVVTKNSALKQNPMVSIEGKKYKAKILFRDKSEDLALLVLNKRIHSAIALKATAFADSIAVGSILLTPLPAQKSEISICGTALFDLSGKYAKGYLGVSVETKAHKVLITSVSNSSAAYKAGLALGDQILSIDDIAVSSAEGFINELENKWPGDNIKIVRKRQQNTDTLTITLAARKYKQMDHVAERFDGGRSKRRDGFAHVFIHDGAIKPAECGSPIFDNKGKFVGINIARYSRTSSIAIDAQAIVNIITAHL